MDKDTLDRIFKHALEEYPDECCGIVTGSKNSYTVHRCNNIQNQLHAEDPARYPRDARTAYVIERSEFNGIVASAKEKEEEVTAFYHSHTEHEAYFSEEDLAAQTVFGEPEFPDSLHIVVSVMNGKIHDIKYFKWDRDLESFVVLKTGVK